MALESPTRGSGNPAPLGGWDRGVSGVDWPDGSVLRVAAIPMRCGLTTSRNRRHRNRTSTSTSPKLARHVRRRRTNPALSRNLKPPPLGGGVFTGDVKARLDLHLNRRYETRCEYPLC